MRIGNFVKEATLGVCKVRGIHNDIVWVGPMLGSDNDKKVNIEELKPIELNLNWLLAFSFSLYSSKVSYRGISISDLTKPNKYLTEYWNLSVPLEKEKEVVLDRFFVKKVYFPYRKDIIDTYNLFMYSQDLVRQDFTEHINDKYKFHQVLKEQVTYHQPNVHILQNVFIKYLDSKLELNIRNTSIIN